MALRSISLFFEKDGVEAKLVDGQERFELKQGDLTVCRFDDVDGEYYLFAGKPKLQQDRRRMVLMYGWKLITGNVGKKS
ncbi:MAG: hypothetical protein ACLTS6_14060 [Anaerobutyricum sp.]